MTRPAILRLKLPSRVLDSGPGPLMQLFAAARQGCFGRARQVKQCLSWALDCVDPEERGVGSAIDEWFRRCFADRGRFQAHFRRAACRARIRAYDDDRLARRRKRLTEWSRNAAEARLLGQVIEGPEVYAGYNCGRTDGNVSQMRKRIAREHLLAQHPVARAAGAACHGCGRDYDSYSRLVRHLPKA